MKPGLDPERYFDAAEHLREKEVARRQDAEDLASGRISPKELRDKNAHFAGLKVKIDFDSSNLS
jgi:hypothetical protein